LLAILKENPDLRQAIPKAFKQTDAAFMAKCNKEKIRSGSTIATVLITKDKLYVAWAGDCLVSLHFGNGQAKQLVNGHRPEREVNLFSFLVLERVLNYYF
jgi:serine/threonine protein phosphatase PrpC